MQLTNDFVIRLGTIDDIDAVAAIYEELHTEEECGRAHIGWQRGVYPVRSTAAAAVQAGELFVLEKNGSVLAAARINKQQAAEYAAVKWAYKVAPEQIMVLHTLVVSPVYGGRGCGKRLVRFYEEYAKEQGCLYLRMDTNALNTAARNLYASLGYREADIIPCVFNGIAGVQLVCLEKYLGEA